MPDKMIEPSHDLMLRVREAFLTHGYENLTMVQLADDCKFTRRALYHYFNSKESAYRAVIRHFNAVAVTAGLEAGQAARRAGGSALDVLATTLDTRYGDTRRRLNGSPHIFDLNAEAFRRCRDIMIESAIAFHAELEELIRELAADGLMALQPGRTPAELAQLLTDAARGVNQTLPPIATEDYAARYRQIVEAILFGAAVPAAAAAREPAPGRTERPRTRRAGG